ncbi:hypothetical protein PENTCL1PPCAC_7855, partial [Pristionchus entomophagus]
LQLAAARGHFTCVKHISRCCTRQVDDMNRDGLIHASINGQTRIVAYFLKSTSLDHDLVDSERNTCLHYACAYGWLPIVKMYVEIDFSMLQLQNREGLTPPVCAFRNGHFGIISWFLENGFAQFIQEDPITEVNIKENVEEWIAAHND